MKCRVLSDIRHKCEYNGGGLSQVLLLDIRDFKSFQFQNDGFYDSFFVEQIKVLEPNYIELDITDGSNYVNTRAKNYTHTLTTFVRSLHAPATAQLYLSQKNKYLVILKTFEGRLFAFGHDGGASLSFSQQTGQVGEVSGYNIKLTKESAYPLFEVATLEQQEDLILPDEFVKGRRKKTLARLITTSKNAFSDYFFINSTDYHGGSNPDVVHNINDDFNGHEIPDYGVYDVQFTGFQQDIYTQEIGEAWYTDRTLGLDYGQSWSAYHPSYPSTINDRERYNELKFSKNQILLLQPDFSRDEFLQRIGGPAYPYNSGISGVCNLRTNNGLRLYDINDTRKTYNYMNKQEDINAYLDCVNISNGFSIYYDFFDIIPYSVTVYATKGTTVYASLHGQSENSSKIIGFTTPAQTATEDGWLTLYFDNTKSPYNTGKRGTYLSICVEGKIGYNDSRLNYLIQQPIGVITGSSWGTERQAAIDPCIGLVCYRDSYFKRNGEYLWRIPDMLDFMQLVGQAPINEENIVKRTWSFLGAAREDFNKTINGAEFNNTSGFTLYPMGDRGNNEDDLIEGYGQKSVLAVGEKGSLKKVVLSKNNLSIENIDSRSVQVRYCKHKTDAELGYKYYIDEETDEVLMLPYLANSDYLFFSDGDNRNVNEIKMENMNQVKRLLIENGNRKNFSIDLYIKPEFNPIENVSVLNKLDSCRIETDGMGDYWLWNFGNIDQISIYALKKDTQYTITSNAPIGNNMKCLIHADLFTETSLSENKHLHGGEAGTKITTLQKLEVTTNKDCYLHVQSRFNNQEYNYNITGQRVNTFRESIATTNGIIDIPIKYRNEKYYFILKGIDFTDFWQANLELENYVDRDKYIPLTRGLERGIALRYTNREHMKVCKKWSEIQIEAKEIKAEIATID